MVINDLYFIGVTFPPNEADTPTIVDSDAVLACTVSLQGLQPIARKYEQVVKAAGSIEHGQFSPCSRLQIGRQAVGWNSLPNAFRFLVLEGSDHGQNNNGKRPYGQDRLFAPFMSL